jgi:N-carbamoyl-L-amino-acid hydrolase
VPASNAGSESTVPWEESPGLIAASARELGLTTKLMPSVAGHDAQDVARIGPAAMIFAPSVGGISHSLRELSQAEAGANVLPGTVLRVDRER